MLHDGGGGGGASWDEVPKTKGPIPGTNSYVESLLSGGKKGGGGGDRAGSYVETLFKPSTPYVEMAAAPAPVQTQYAVDTVERRGSATDVLHDFARVSGGQSTDPAKIAARDEENRQVTEVKRWKAPKTYALTWDEYLALNDEQRAAVDFNTMLSKAREKDLNTEYEEPAPEEQEAYDDAMRRMFGEDRGSEAFAPATLGVLDRLEFKPTAEDDFDNILGGEYFITTKELKQFTTEPTQSVMYADGDVATAGLVGEEQLAASTAKITEALQRGHAAIQNFRQVAARAVNPVATSFGGEPIAKEKDPKQLIGFGQSPDDLYFRQALEALSRTDFPDEVRQNVLADLHAQLGPKNLLPDFMVYADAMTRDKDLYKEVSSWTQGATYFKPTEVRSTLNLDRGGD